MNTKSNILILMLITACTLFSCIMPVDDDEEPTLPPITQEGKNTFGCKVNGKVWVPKTDLLGFNKLTISYDGSSLDIQGWIRKDKDNFLETVSISARDLYQEGVYNITPLPFNGKLFRKNGISSDCWHSVKPENSKIVITYLDKTARIISGTFEYLDMKALKSFCDTTDVVNITEGRFDVKY